MRITLILIVILFSSHSFGQWAIVKDVDGFVNIREKPSAQSKIVDTLSSGKIVFLASDPEGEWYYVDAKAQKYSVGYINRSRLQLIDNFTKFKIVKKNDSILKLQLDSRLLTIRVGKFQAKQHKLKYQIEKGIKYLVSIDAKSPVGINEDLPVDEYKSFIFKKSDKEYKLGKKYWENLYEPDLSRTNAYLDEVNNIIYIDANNSDGQGGYSLLLVISDGQIVEQEIWTP